MMVALEYVSRTKRGLYLPNKFRSRVGMGLRIGLLHFDCYSLLLKWSTSIECCIPCKCRQLCTFKLCMLELSSSAPHLVHGSLVPSGTLPPREPSSCEPSHRPYIPPHSSSVRSPPAAPKAPSASSEKTLVGRIQRFFAVRCLWIQGWYIKLPRLMMTYVTLVKN